MATEPPPPSDLGLLTIKERAKGESRLKPMKAPTGTRAGFPTPSRTKKYTTRPIASTAADAPTATAARGSSGGGDGRGADFSLPQPPRRAAATTTDGGAASTQQQPRNMASSASAAGPGSAAYRDPMQPPPRGVIGNEGIAETIDVPARQQQQATGRQLLGGTNDSLTPDDLEPLVTGKTASGEALKPSDTVGVALKVLRSVLPAQRLIAVNALCGALRASPVEVHAALTQSIESGQRLFLLVRCVGDANVALHEAALGLLETLLESEDGDEASRQLAVKLSLYGAPVADDEAESSMRAGGAATGDQPFEAISEMAFDDVRGAAAELQLHVRLCDSLRYSDMAQATRQWHMLDLIADSPHGARGIMGNPKCATAIRQALDTLLVEGILLMDGGVDIAASVAGVLRRCASVSKRAATIIFSNYGEVLSLVATTILNDDHDSSSPGHGEALLLNDVGRRCCLSIFSLFANCARHGFWRDDMTDLLVEGRAVGSLRVLEALVLTRGSDVHKTLKAFISDHVIHIARVALRDDADAEGVTKVEFASALHLLATWFSTGTFETLAHGEKTPIELVQSLEALSKHVVAPSTVAQLLGMLVQSRHSPTAVADSAAIAYGKVRLALAIARLLPKTRKACYNLVATVCDGLSGLPPATMSAARRNRALLGPAVAAILELVTQAVSDEWATAGVDIVRTSQRVRSCLTALELVRVTKHGLDSVHDLLLPALLPTSALGVADLPDASIADARAVLIEQMAKAISPESAAAGPDRAGDDDDDDTGGKSAVSTLTLPQWPWFLVPSYYRVEVRPGVFDATVAVVWVRWFRWLLGHVGLEQIPHTDAPHLVATRALVAVCNVALKDVSAARGVEPLLKDIAAVCATTAVHAPLTAETSAVAPGDVSPALEQLCEDVDGSANAAKSPTVFFIVLVLLSSACRADLRFAVLSAWIRNATAARNTAALGNEVAEDPAFTSVLAGCWLKSFVGSRWSGNDALQLIDCLVEYVGSPDSTDPVAPFAVLLAEVVARVRLTKSAFEVDMLDGALSDQLQGAFDVETWRAGSGHGTLLDVAQGGSGGMVD